MSLYELIKCFTNTFQYSLRIKTCDHNDNYLYTYLSHLFIVLQFGLNGCVIGPFEHLLF